MLVGQLHLYGRFANVMRLELGTGNFMPVRLRNLKWRWDVRGRLSTEHFLFELDQHPVLLKPHADLLWTNQDYLPGSEIFLNWQAGLAVELPF
jgi:hypothetical protein